EVTLADLDQLAAPGPERDRHPSAGDIAVGGIVPVVVPAGRGASGEDNEAGPDPIVGEGWPRWMFVVCSAGGASSACLVMTWGRSMASSDLDRCPQGACAGRHGSHNPRQGHDRVTAAPEYGGCPGR